MAKRIQNGDSIDYTAVADITAGTIISIAGQAGVVNTDLEAGELGSAEVTGVYEVPKASGLVVAEGVTVYWDMVALTAVLASSGNTIVLGRSVKAAGNGETEVLVRLDPNA
jgi:predicted RecA/RadA family phage recombinase